MSARGTSRRISTASPISTSIWCSRAPGRARARELNEAVEDVGGDLNAATDREGTSFTATLLAEHLPLGHRADLRHDPAAAFPARGSGAREGGRASGAGRGARHAVRHHLRRSVGRPPGRTSRSAARCSATKTSVGAITVDDLHGWRTERYRGGSLILVAAGKVDHDELVRLAEARFGDLPDGDDRAAGAGPLRRRPRAPAGRAPTRPISPPPTRRRACTIPISTRRGCSATSPAPAPRRGCSTRCARSAASLIRSGRRSSPIARTACSIAMPRPRGARPPRRRR